MKIMVIILLASMTTVATTIKIVDIAVMRKMR